MKNVCLKSIKKCSKCLFSVFIWVYLLCLLFFNYCFPFYYGFKVFMGCNKTKIFRSPGNTDKQMKERTRKKKMDKSHYKLNIQASTKYNNATIINKQPHQQRLWLRRVDQVVYQSEGRWLDLRFSLVSVKRPRASRSVSVWMIGLKSVCVCEWGW